VAEMPTCLCGLHRHLHEFSLRAGNDFRIFPREDFWKGQKHGTISSSDQHLSSTKRELLPDLGSAQWLAALSMNTAPDSLLCKCWDILKTKGTMYATPAVQKSAFGVKETTKKAMTVLWAITYYKFNLTFACYQPDNTKTTKKEVLTSHEL